MPLDYPANASRKGAFGSHTVSLGMTIRLEAFFASGEVLLGALNKSGFEITDDHHQSDAIIVNTCTFVADAKSESLDAVLEAASLCKDNPQKRLIVTGCMAQRYADELAVELPEVDAFIGFDGYDQVPKELAELVEHGREEGAAPRVIVGSASPPFRAEVERVRMMPAHSAYLRIAEGCDHACSFCAIPGFRGKFRSKQFSNIVEEAQALVAQGAVELNLIAEDTNQWGYDQCASSNVMLTSQPGCDGCLIGSLHPVQEGWAPLGRTVARAVQD